MEAISILLVVLSGFLHSIWNFLTKKSSDKLMFLYIAKLFELIIFLPVVAYILLRSNLKPFVIILVLASGIANTVYWFSLSKAYTYSDLSLVYPIARSAPALIAVIAVILGMEKLSFTGLIGIFLVNAGIFVIAFEHSNFGEKLLDIVKFRNKGVGYAFLTLLSVVTYSFIDKFASPYINPLAYVYLFELVSFILLSVIIFKTKTKKTLHVEFQKNYFSIFIASIFIVISYAIVVYVMRMSSLSYIVAVREVGIVFGVLEGVIFLKESFGKERIIASLLIVAGIIIISLSF